MATVTIERLGHLGDGIAPGPIYVPRGLPNEVVEGEVTGDRIAAPRFIQPSPDRVSAPCRHYKSCGGCALQHASDDFVESWKRGVVVAALAAQGLPAPIRAMHISPPGSRRRATFSARRTKKGVTIGFHAASSDVITDISGCLVLRPRLIDSLQSLGEIAAMGASRKGEVRIAVTESETGLDVDISGGKRLDIQLRTGLAGRAEAADLSRLTWNGDLVCARRTALVTFGRAEVPVPPGAFLQATVEGEAVLAAAVRDAVGNAGRVADLFSGCGTFALPLAEASMVHAVESEKALLDALDAGWRHATGLRQVTTECRDLFRRPLLIEELSRFDAVVIDPPRAGAEAQCRNLAQSGVPRIAAVSCNPVTFARDARILTVSGYEMNWIEVVDQFRWSPHIELVAAFQLAR